MIDWIDTIFTRLKSALGKKYDKIFVDTTITNSPSHFPAVYIKQLGIPATQSSFTNVQCAAISTIEIQTFSDISAQEAREICIFCVDKMSEMGYGLIYGPEDVTTQSDLKRYIARFRRTIGAGDTI